MNGFVFDRKLTLGNILVLVTMLATLTLAWGRLEVRLEEVAKKAESVSQIKEDVAVIKTKLDLLLEDRRMQKVGAERRK